jgi:hypothetical protein
VDAAAASSSRRRRRSHPTSRRCSTRDARSTRRCVSPVTARMATAGACRVRRAHR